MQQIDQTHKLPNEKKEKATDFAPTTILPIDNSSVRKSPKNIFVSLPSGFHMADDTGEGYINEDTTAEKLEKKAQELLNKVQAYTQEKNLPKKDNTVLHTAYPISSNLKNIPIELFLFHKIQSTFGAANQP